MKTLHKLPLLLLLLSLMITACKKEKKDDNTPTGPLGINYPQDNAIYLMIKETG
ncbi:hypothetical protein ACFSOV_17215 [Pedobacter petrophilus]|uniref:hypothetical protein n=1 Tax=Pedobacter petrophilus TaxID=1908241 RepID=UPI0036445997